MTGRGAAALAGFRRPTPAEVEAASVWDRLAGAKLTFDFGAGAAARRSPLCGTHATALARIRALVQSWLEQQI